MEVWRNIPGYEFTYRVSNLGNVERKGKQIQRKGDGAFIYLKSLVMKQCLSNGYKAVRLSKDGKCKNFRVHQLVAMAFLGHIPNGYKQVVDHKNNDKLDNRLENLQLVTQRENSIKETKGKSKYPGVYWNNNKSVNPWGARIRMGKERIFLGYFDNEYDAYLAYQKKLKQITIN